MELTTKPRLPACLDCGAARTGPFCHVCGQGPVDPDATVRQLIGGATRDLFSWDDRALRTLRVLLTQPGALAAAWAEGQRMRYVPPLRLFLVLGAVLVGLGSVHRWIALEAVGVERPASEEASHRGPSSRSAAYWVGRGIGGAGLNTVLLLAPLVGFAYWALFRGRRPRLAPHLVHALHIGCVVVLSLLAWRMATLAWLVTVPARTLGDTLNPTARGLGPADALGLSWMTSVVAYSAVSVRRFYGVARWRAVLAAPLVVGVPLAVVVGAALVVYVVLLAL